MWFNIILRSNCGQQCPRNRIPNGAIQNLIGFKISILSTSTHRMSVSVKKLLPRYFLKGARVVHLKNWRLINLKIQA